MPIISIKWKHYAVKNILKSEMVFKKCINYRNLKEKMAEREVKINNVTVMRWLHQYSLDVVGLTAGERGKIQIKSRLLPNDQITTFQKE